MQIGAFLGYTSFGLRADRFGRRPVFLTFVSVAILVPIYGQWGRRPSALMLMGPLIGFFGHGYFSVLCWPNCFRRHPRHRAGSLLQRGPRSQRARATYHRRFGGPFRHRQRAGVHVAVLRRRRRADLPATGNPGARN